MAAHIFELGGNEIHQWHRTRFCNFPGYRSQGGERLGFCDMALRLVMARLGDLKHAALP